MKPLIRQISSIEITWVLVLTLILGAGIQVLTQNMEMSAQMHFIDYALGILIVLAGVKFVTEKI